MNNDKETQREKIRSVRTEYRQKRIKLLYDMVLIILQMLVLTGFQLEKVKLSDFKKIKKDLEELLTRAKYY